MRLDKFFTTVGLLSRKEAAAAVRRGEVTVNGQVAKAADMKVDPDTDTVTLAGEAVVYREFVYLWLNKPEGYVSATEDGRYPVVTELAPPEYRRLSLFPCGRLDRDTVGLMLLTNDGALSHALLSPKRGVEKIYRFRTDAPLPSDAEERLLAGMVLGDEVCKSADLTLSSDRRSGEIVLTEGKYHQIKRMMAKEGSEVLTLERLSFAEIPLDERLARGTWRYLTDAEISRLRSSVCK